MAPENLKALGFSNVAHVVATVRRGWVIAQVCSPASLTSFDRRHQIWQPNGTPAIVANRACGGVCVCVCG